MKDHSPAAVLGSLAALGTAAGVGSPLLGRWSLVGILLLAILHISIRVILLLVHAFWRTLSTMTVLFPIIVFLA